MFAQGNSVASWFGELLELGPLVLGAMLIIVLAMTIIWLTVRVIPNDHAAVVEKLWSAERLGARRADHRAQRRGRLPGRAAARWRSLWLVALAVSRAQSAAGDRFRKARSATCMPATASRCRRAKRWAALCSATTFRMRAVSERRWIAQCPVRPARPPTGDPARRRVRHQPGAVHRDYRNQGPRAAALARSAGGRNRRSVARRAVGNRRLRPDRGRRADERARSVGSDEHVEQSTASAS